MTSNVVCFERCFHQHCLFHRHACMDKSHPPAIHGRGTPARPRQMRMPQSLAYRRRERRQHHVHVLYCRLLLWPRHCAPHVQTYCWTTRSKVIPVATRMACSAPRHCTLHRSKPTISSCTGPSLLYPVSRMLLFSILLYGQWPIVLEKEEEKVKRPFFIASLQRSAHASTLYNHIIRKHAQGCKDYI